MMVVVVNGITALTTIVKKSEQREWYSTQEFAELVGKAEFTVREWCRLGRIRGKKQSSGRGPNQAWAISHAEIERYRKDGLLERQQPSL